MFYFKQNIYVIYNPLPLPYRFSFYIKNMCMIIFQ